MQRVRLMLAAVLVVLFSLGVALSGCAQQQASGDKKADKATEKVAEKPAEKAADKGEKYPSKPIKVIVPMAAGGSTDRPMRLLQPFLEKELGATLVIENNAGGGGSIGTVAAYNAKPDGYTLFFTIYPSPTARAIIAGGYDPTKFVPIYNVLGGDNQAISVPFDSPFKTLPEIIEASKKKPMTVSSSGIGNMSHVNVLLIEKKTGAKFQTVPFNTANEAALALAGKQVDITSNNQSAALPLIAQKKARMICVMGAKRGQYAPDVPTAKEQGVDIVLEQAAGFFGPPGFPKDKLDFLAKAIEKAAKNPEFEKAATQGKESIMLLGTADFNKLYMDMHNTVMTLEKELKAVQSK